MNLKVWLHGLAAAAVGAFSSSVTALVVDPAKFNFTTGGFLALGEVSLVAAIVAVAGYLAKSPLPDSSASSSQAQKLGVILLCVLLFGSATGCPQKAATTLPQGALNTFDADSYSALITAQATLTVFKADTALMAIPQAKVVVNQAIQDYDLALSAWKAYHAGGGNSTAVTLALTTLSTDILKAQGLIPGGGK